MISALTSYFAGIYTQQGNPEDAAGSYRKVLDIDPNAILAKQNLGLVVISLGDVDVGLEWIEKSLSERREDLRMGTPRFNAAGHAKRLRELHQQLVGLLDAPELAGEREKIASMAAATLELLESIDGE